MKGTALKPATGDLARLLAKRAATRAPAAAKEKDDDGDELDEDFVAAVAGVRSAKTDREAAHALRHAIDLAKR